jgi:hypothetical protein
MSQTTSSSQSTPARTYVVTGAAGFIGSLKPTPKVTP